MKTDSFLFKSERLGFRNWTLEDLDALAALNADEEVMKYFPTTLTFMETESLLIRLQQQFDNHGYTYFSTIELETDKCIGFIGLAYQDYEAPFNPAVDIGWRLDRDAWGKGYATEGAKACLDYGFNTLNLSQIVAVCTLNNQTSERVMQKIGMKKQSEFKHPKLKDAPAYEDCMWYSIEQSDYFKL